MDINLIERICKEKNLSFIKIIDNLYVYKKNNDFNYRDIIGFYCLQETIAEWKEIEGTFVSEVERVLLNAESEFSIEPYLIFFVDKEKYFESLEDVVKIERDEFYCRKFIYPLGDEENVIEKLPFGSPLTFQIKRRNFLSAEKTLLNMGFDRNKAQALTKKAIPEQLKEQIIEYFRDFELAKKVKDANIKDKIVKNSVRLKEMQVQGFRIYGKNEVFDLDADLVVLYGANGLGKTSFFDAFEYGVTEEIKRFSNKEDKPDITKLVRNFSVDDADNVKIKLKFEISSENGNQDFEFERIMGKAKVDLLLPGGKTKKEETKGILKEITQKNISLKKDEVVKLFRATHINNQGDSELTENVIKSSSSISNEILGKMISFEDYTDVDDNLNKLINKNNEKMRKLQENDLKSLKEKAIELKDKYDLQQNVLQNRASSETIQYLEYDLITKIRENYNIVVEKMEKGFVENELISKIEAELNSIQHELNNINEAKQLKSELLKIKDENDKLELEKIKLSIKYLKNNLVTVEQQEKESELHKENYESKLKENEKILMECDRYLQISLNLNVIVKNIQILSIKKEKTALEIDKLQKKIMDINKEENARMEELLLIDRALYGVREEIKNIEEIYIDFDNYIKNQERKGFILGRLVDYKKEIDSVTKEKENLNKQISDINIQVNNIELEIEHEKIQNNEIENLLLSIKKHINKNYCPVCNSAFETQQDILDKVDEKIKNISEHQKIKYQQLLNLKDHREIKQKQYVDINSKLNNLKSSFNELVKEKEEVDISCEKFVVNINKLGITGNKDGIKAVLDEKRVVERITLEKLNQNSATGKENEIRFENLQKELYGKKEELNEIDKNILSQNNLSDSWNKELLKLDNLQVFVQVNFEDASKRLKFSSGINSEIESIRMKMKEVEERISLCKSNKETYLKDLIRLEKELEEGVKINNEYRQIESKLLLMRDAKKVDLCNLDIDYEKQSERFSRLTSLKAKALTFLKMVEFEALSSVQKELKLEMDINEEKIKIAEKEIANYKAINEKILEVQKEVKSVQYDIVKNYCKNVEPLVSIIQNRLRALYGFTDLSLSLDEDNDKVNIITSHYALEQKREQESIIPNYELTDKNQLKPCQYLSEAQKNIINLSLFLSNVLSQNWSGFQTVFLDDPVQHFDDLNAYAFLELLKSLMLDNDGNEKKQIIMSTCDSKFFGLIKEKFNMLKKKGRAKYYVFESINKEGPVIKAL